MSFSPVPSTRPTLGPPARCTSTPTFPTWSRYPATTARWGACSFGGAGILDATSRHASDHDPVFVRFDINPLAITLASMNAAQANEPQRGGLAGGRGLRPARRSRAGAAPARLNGAPGGEADTDVPRSAQIA